MYCEPAWKSATSDQSQNVNIPIPYSKQIPAGRYINWAKTSYVGQHKQEGLCEVVMPVNTCAL